ncbi:MAG TPA: vitamin K epoxide reductase family protein [Candidatus Paceibacterota bacterium]
MNLRKLLTTPFQKSVSKWIIILLIVVSAIGFADATFLTIEHYINKIPPCTTSGCEVVLTSSYSVIAGVPVALIGALYYLFLLILLVSYLDAKKEIFLRVALLFTVVGFIFSVYFFSLQAFVIKAFCQYCLVSIVTSAILFVTSVIVFIKNKAKNTQENITDNYSV